MRSSTMVRLVRAPALGAILVVILAPSVALAAAEDYVDASFTFDKDAYAPGDGGRVKIQVTNVSGTHATLHAARIILPWGDVVVARVDSPKILGVDAVAIESTFIVPRFSIPRDGGFVLETEVRVPGSAPDSVVTERDVGVVRLSASPQFVVVAFAYSAGVIAMVAALARDVRRGPAASERPGFRIRAWAVAAIVSYGTYLFLAVPFTHPTRDVVPASAWVVLAGIAFSVLYATPFGLANWTRVGASIDGAAFSRVRALTVATRERPRAAYAVWGPSSLVLASLIVLVAFYLMASGAWALLAAIAFVIAYMSAVRATARAAGTSAVQADDSASMGGT